MARSREPFGELGDQSRLPDPRVAFDHRDARAAFAREPELVLEERKRLAASDERLVDDRPRDHGSPPVRAGTRGPCSKPARMRRRTLLAGLAAAAGAPNVARAAMPDNGADLIVTAATIRTVDPRAPRATAFAIRDGRFSYVGSREGVRALRGRRTRVLELGDAVVLPGLIDAHLHFLSVGMALGEVELEHAASYDEVIRRTVAFARTVPDAWIVGFGWDQNLWPGKAFPTHEALSTALPDRAVVLGRVDGHAVLANAKAMQLAGIGPDTAAPAGGRILRDEHGAPTGVFVDDATALVERAIPPPSREQRIRACAAALRECHRWGLTAIAEPGVDDEGLAAYAELLAAGTFTLRNHAMLAGSDDALLARHLPQRTAHARWRRTARRARGEAVRRRRARLARRRAPRAVQRRSRQRRPRAYAAVACRRGCRARAARRIPGLHARDRRSRQSLRPRRV